MGMISSEGDKTVYDIYNTKCEIDITAQPDNLTLYLGNEATFKADTSFKTKTLAINGNGVTVYDTRYFDRKLGALITLYSKDDDENETKVTGLKGTYFEIAGERYYPKSDGVTRVKMADIVSNVLTDITINTANSEEGALRPGKYKLKIEAFASADGIYYGTENINPTTGEVEELPHYEIELTIISNEYGLKSTIPDNQVIIDKTTGYTLKENGYAVTEASDEEASNNLDVTLSYKYSVDNPYISVELQRRKYDDIYSTDYTSENIDLMDYVEIESGRLQPTDIDENKKIYEFLSTEKIEDNAQLEDDGKTYWYTQQYKIKNTGLKSGTYRLVFTLYDVKEEIETPPETPAESTNTTNTSSTETLEPEETSKYQYIGEVYSYIIIK